MCVPYTVCVMTTNEACLEQEVMDEDEFDCVWSTKA